MAKRKAIIHRYDNGPDILAVERNGCSEVYQRVADDVFDIVIVVPTTSAKTTTAIVADAASRQYTPSNSRSWPGRPDRYPVRIDVKKVRYTTLAKVREAALKADVTWQAPWVVKAAILDEDLLF